MKKIWNIVTSIIVILAVLLAVAFMGVRLVGLQVFTVLSGSMEPAYHTGSLIYVKKADYTHLAVGDVITFMLDENTIATHRIVEVVPDATDSSVLRYRTKGDANSAVDGSLVHYKNVIGTPVFSIPKLGYLANYIQHPRECTRLSPPEPSCCCWFSCRTSSAGTTTKRSRVSTWQPKCRPRNSRPHSFHQGLHRKTSLSLRTQEEKL